MTDQSDKDQEPQSGHRDDAGQSAQDYSSSQPFAQQNVQSTGSPNFPINAQVGSAGANGLHHVTVSIHMKGSEKTTLLDGTRSEKDLDVTLTAETDALTEELEEVVDGMSQGLVRQSPKSAQRLISGYTDMPSQQPSPIPTHDNLLGGSGNANANQPYHDTPGPSTPATSGQGYGEASGFPTDNSSSVPSPLAPAAPDDTPQE